MKRETRLNLIFLAIILAILTPGGVMLFRKKLQPALTPMYVPPGVQREHAFISPLETPPGKTRVEPPLTARWIESLVRQEIGDADAQRDLLRPTDVEGLPLMSQKRTFQVVAARPTARGVRLWLLVWNTTDAEPAAWTVLSDDAPRDMFPIAFRPRPVPSLVRQELGETGVTRPAHNVIWQELDIELASSNLVKLQAPSGDFVNFVPSFTNPTANSN